MSSCIARRIVIILFVFVSPWAPINAYAIAHGCGHPVSQGLAPTATDALFTLRASVGLETCGLAICDVDGSCTITATDALTTLAKAVGQAVSLDCACVGSTTTSTTTVTSTTTTTVALATTTTTVAATTTTLPTPPTSTTITTSPTTTTTLVTSTTAPTVPASTTTTTMPPGVQLHLENITPQSVEVWIDTDVCIKAYQFTVSGATVVSANGGLTEAAGFHIETGSTLVFVNALFAESQIAAGSTGQLIRVLLSNSVGFFCTGQWVVGDCNALEVPAASIYFRRLDGSLCRSDQPGCFLCDF